MKDIGLRKKAEQLLHQRGTAKSEQYFNDIEKLVEELNVHQIELEMQAEELQRNNELINKERKKFQQLYLNAPVAYFTLNKNGNIYQLNNMAAELIGLPIQSIYKTSFFPFIDQQYKQDYTKLLKRAFQRDTIEHGEIVILNHNKQKIAAAIQALAYFDDDLNQKLCRCAFIDITGKVKAEQELLKSKKLIEEQEEFLRETQKAAKIGSIKSIFIEDNWQSSEALDKLFGIDKDYKKTIESWVQLIHPDDRDRMQNYLRNEFVREKKEFNNEYRVIRPIDKQIIWVYGYGKPIFDNKNNVIGVHGTIQDITDRKKAEQALIENEEKYRLLYEFNPMPMSIFDVETLAFLSVNNAFIDKYGFTKDEFLNMTILDIRPESEIERLKQTVGISDRGPTNLGVYIHKKKNGEIMQVEIIRHELDFNTRKAKLVLINDVTDKIKAKNDLIFINAELTLAKEKAEESEEKFKTYITSSPISIFISDKTGRYVFANSAVCELLGYSFDEILKMSIPDIFAPEQLQNGISNFSELKENGRISDFEFQIKRKDNTFVNVVLDAIKLSENEYIAFVKDLTELKQAELIIKQQNEELKKLNVDLNRFISILAHDLKNPFSSIIGFLELLTRNIRKYDVDKIENQLNIVYKSSQNIYHLLDDLLSWARTQSGKFPFNPAKINVSAICKDVSEHLKLNAINKNIAINNIVDETIYILADANMLYVIMRNLISNAIKFTNKDGGITIYTETNLKYVTITVSDNGVGIEPDKLVNLFDISYKNSTDGTGNETGTGLGLLLCKELIEKHSGKIWVESELGKGSDFKFTIPLYID